MSAHGSLEGGARGRFCAIYVNPRRDVVIGETSWEFPREFPPASASGNRETLRCADEQRRWREGRLKKHALLCVFQMTFPRRSISRRAGCCSCFRRMTRARVRSALSANGTLTSSTRNSQSSRCGRSRVSGSIDVASSSRAIVDLQVSSIAPRV